MRKTNLKAVDYKQLTEELLNVLVYFPGLEDEVAARPNIIEFFHELEELCPEFASTALIAVFYINEAMTLETSGDKHAIGAVLIRAAQDYAKAGYKPTQHRRGST